MIGNRRIGVDPTNAPLMRLSLEVLVAEALELSSSNGDAKRKLESVFNHHARLTTANNGEPIMNIWELIQRKLNEKFPENIPQNIQKSSRFEGIVSESIQNFNCPHCGKPHLNSQAVNAHKGRCEKNPRIIGQKSSFV